MGSLKYYNESNKYSVKTVGLINYIKLLILEVFTCKPIIESLQIISTRPEGNPPASKARRVGD